MAYIKDIMERAWNAAIDHAAEYAGDPNLEKDLQAPNNVFDNWFEREVLHPPESDDRELRGT